MFSDQQVEALVVAVLSVGLWPAERVRAALPRLREVGVLSPTNVAAMELGVLTVKLAKHGYGRGLFESMYDERLQAVMREIAAGHLDEISNLVPTGNRDNFMNPSTGDPWRWSKGGRKRLEGSCG